MKIGFLTRVMRGLDYKKLVVWVSENGIKALEVATHSGSQHIDPEKILEMAVVHIKKLLSDNDMMISAIAH